MDAGDLQDRPAQGRRRHEPLGAGAAAPVRSVSAARAERTIFDCTYPTLFSVNCGGCFLLSLLTLLSYLFASYLFFYVIFISHKRQYLIIVQYCIFPMHSLSHI